MSEERDLFSRRKPLARSGANKIQVHVLCLPTIIAVSSVAAENERIPSYNCVCGVETTARSRMLDVETRLCAPDLRHDDAGIRPRQHV